MTEEKTTQINETTEEALQNAEGAAAETEEDAQNLYQMEMERYQATVDGSPEGALDRYGFTLFHSLTAENFLKYRSEIGFQPQCALDYYNLGCVAASDEDTKVALKHFVKCLSMSADFAPAIFNIASINEQQGNKTEAIKLYEKYCNLVMKQSSHGDYQVASIEDREAEVEAIRNYIKEL